MQPVDAVRDVQRGTLVPLREEVPHGPIHRSREANRAAFVGDQGKRSVDGADRRRIAAEDTRARASSRSMLKMRFRSGSRRSTTRLMGYNMPRFYDGRGYDITAL